MLKLEHFSRNTLWKFNRTYGGSTRKTQNNQRQSKTNCCQNTVPKMTSKAVGDWPADTLSFQAKRASILRQVLSAALTAGKHQKAEMLTLSFKFKCFFSQNKCYHWLLKYKSGWPRENPVPWQLQWCNRRKLCFSVIFEQFNHFLLAYLLAVIQTWLLRILWEVW